MLLDLLDASTRLLVDEQTHGISSPCEGHPAGGLLQEACHQGGTSGIAPAPRPLLEAPESLRRAPGPGLHRIAGLQEHLLQLHRLLHDALAPMAIHEQRELEDAVGPGTHHDIFASGS